MKINPNVITGAKKFARKYGTAAATTALLVGVVGAVSADASPGDGPYTGSNIVDGTLWMSDLSPSANTAYLSTYDNTVRSISVVNGSLGQVDFDAATNAKINAVGTGEQGPAGPAGPAGPQGPKGDSAIVSVTAMTSLTNRPDSGLHGTWALDNLVRQFSITRASAVPAANCGPTATKCWFYTGSLADSGTFASVAGADSPQAGTPITGTVTGSVTGAAKLEFYATSDAPDPALVDATVSGAAHPTAQWAKMFFAAGTTVTDADLKDWGWDYTDPELCNHWVNAKAGNTGDITSVNAC